MGEIKRPGFGWEKQFPDYRDFKFAERPDPLQAVVIPERFSLRQHCSPVRNQGNLGSCTGFAGTSVAEMLRRMDADEHSTIYSPLHLYYWGRTEDGDQWRLIDSGAYLRDTAKVMARRGVVPESRYPYLVNKFKDLPTRSAEREARRWRSGTYYLCKTVEETCAALAQGLGVLGGFVCYTNMFTRTVDETGDVPMPSGGIEGGHALHFTGYDRVAQRFEFKNSWGDWGNGGYGTLPFAFMQQGLMDDVWAITKESAETRQDRPWNRPVV